MNVFQYSGNHQSRLLPSLLVTAAATIAAFVCYDSSHLRVRVRQHREAKERARLRRLPCGLTRSWRQPTRTTWPAPEGAPRVSRGAWLRNWHQAGSLPWEVLPLVLTCAKSHHYLQDGEDHVILAVRSAHGPAVQETLQAVK